MEQERSRVLTSGPQGQPLEPTRDPASGCRDGLTRVPQPRENAAPVYPAARAKGCGTAPLALWLVLIGG